MKLFKRRKHSKTHRFFVDLCKMIDELNKLFEAGAFNNIGRFSELLRNSELEKRYSIMKVDYPYQVGENEYKTTFCFFFYSSGYLIETFYCEITGNDKELSSPKINCYSYPCNDIDRSDDWEWV